MANKAKLSFFQIILRAGRLAELIPEIQAQWPIAKKKLKKLIASDPDVRKLSDLINEIIGLFKN